MKQRPLEQIRTYANENPHRHVEQKEHGKDLFNVRE